MKTLILDNQYRNLVERYNSNGQFSYNADNTFTVVFQNKDCKKFCNKLIDASMSDANKKEEIIPLMNEVSKQLSSQGGIDN
jgi:hypothetical protein